MSFIVLSVRLENAYSHPRNGGLEIFLVVLSLSKYSTDALQIKQHKNRLLVLAQGVSKILSRQKN